jgi:PAS domain S-box-containing protein
MSAKNLKILVVEDNEGDYFLVHEYLCSNFSSIDITHDRFLSEAYISLANETYDVILLDLTLPDSNGKDSIYGVIERAKETPVIVLTGYSDRQFAMDSLKLGVQDYLIKDEVNALVLQKSIVYSIERNKIGRNLIQNEKRFRALIENSTDGLMVIDTNGSILDLSSAGQKVLGYSKSEMGNILRTDLIHSDDFHIVKNAIIDIQKLANEIYNIEYRFILADNTIIWIESSFHNLLNEPSVLGIVAHFRNISDRKAAEDAIKISEEKYRYLFNNNPDLILIWELENKSIMDVNDTATKLLGYSKWEFLKMKIFDLHHEKEIDTFQNILTNLNTKKSFVEQEVLRKIAKDGSIIYLDLVFHKIKYEGKTVILSIGSDISDKLKLEQKLEEERYRKRMEITDAVITAQERERQEIGIELHDNVNQILAGSLMYMGLLKKEINKPSELFTDIDKLITGAINEIRRLSHSLIPPSLNELELGEALDHFIAIMKKASLFEIRKDLYDFDEDAISDKLKLAIYRIVQEQFTNIFKHARAKHILIRLYHENDKLYLRIKDDGIGFNASNVSRGVGLINIQTRASLFNGQMEINSTPGEGTELVVTFS